MSEVRIAAEPRTEFGKGAARRVRRAHKVPAVLYGHGAAPRHLSLPGHELMMALKTPNALLVLDIDGASEMALPKAVQRDPIKGFLEHVDLLLVRRGERVVVEVAINVVGAIQPGGLLDHDLVTLAVEADATAIPQSIEISVEGLGVGNAIHAGQVALPEGVTLRTDPEALVLNVLAERTVEQQEAETGAAVEETAPQGEAAGEVPATEEA